MSERKRSPQKLLYHAGVDAPSIAGSERHFARPRVDLEFLDMASSSHPLDEPLALVSLLEFPTVYVAADSPPGAGESLTRRSGRAKRGSDNSTQAMRYTLHEGLRRGKRRHKAADSHAGTPPLQWQKSLRPRTFAEALTLQIERHGDSARSLALRLSSMGLFVSRWCIAKWCRAGSSPQSRRSLSAIKRIERIYKLKAGYLTKCIPHPNRAPLNGWLAGRSQRERQRLSWHLPENFETRSDCMKKEIVDWISKNIIGCATAFGQYQARVQKNAFAIKLVYAPRGGQPSSARASSASKDRVPSALLALEVNDLVDFKTSTFTRVDEQRLGIWNKETVRLHLRRLGLLLGAMATPAHSSTSGPGFPRGSLTLALLVLPSVWDWYLSWRLNRRGSFSLDEVSILRLGISLTRPVTGWLRQRPLLAQRIVLHAPIVTEAEISAARDWASACDTCFQHLKVRLAEVKRIARRHRDPFEAIRVVLGQPEPVVVYRRIADEILKYFPDVRRYPVAAAETARSLLMVRLGLHLGLRQRNLRELLLCLPGQPYRSEFELEYRRRGEMRWCEATKRWEIFIPSVAFKNSDSTFFFWPSVSSCASGRTESLWPNCLVCQRVQAPPVTRIE
jgi:hypothetical protein